ncbi:uncharacterized protein LOC117509315 [Thalassophryne amazonica]|uniref:uncharacterized protein LOC117509315 n=1 Tax=Thalassophryne amazonica TaxID=390379 RepID=UPI0014712E93|nr:uncharacterized protein LOC117509315 [Thalassophryne amazonica]
MGVMVRIRKQQHKLKRFMRFKYLSPVLTIVSVTLLLWTYKWVDIQDLLSSAEGKLPLVAVSGTKTLLMSAYLDRRSGQRKVRVLTVVLRNETVEYRCLLCCQGQPYVSMGNSSIHFEHFGFPYGTADIKCPLPSGCEKPSHIAVTAAEAEDEGLVFLEVQNQNIRNIFKHDFTVCFSTMFDFTNVLQLVQSLEMLQLLGVSNVVIYKTSCSPDVQRILDYYTNTGLVEVIPWSISRYVNVSRGWLPEHGPGDLHYFGQIPVLNDCLYRYMYQTRYLALHDIDELIIPQTVKSWSQLLPKLERKYGADLCFMFENTVFPNSVILPPPASRKTLSSLTNFSSTWQGVTGVNFLAHLYHGLNKAKQKQNFKIIISPRAVFSVTVHGVQRSKKRCVWVDRKTAILHHTRPPPEMGLASVHLYYNSRLLHYSSRLIPAVSTVLRNTGFIPEDINKNL